MQLNDVGFCCLQEKRVILERISFFFVLDPVWIIPEEISRRFLGDHSGDK